ncbi:hypothetical protein GCM10011514_52000 [Emticicia aquatilis]|uniref:Phosphatidic acid phosphatase type 2/haloperoxidase domain-containing protein n=1 Tax=Emticicia aquatilis TaxID=1537369 RepID=A0A916Z9N1_9BACT|nr:vanadium-dependent haloperoxidase [Emticicia aquatilis]GGD81512.1 hypothetical protein GCM10011514_52000 [Emticicia aquatilis]
MLLDFLKYKVSLITVVVMVVNTTLCLGFDNDADLAQNQSASAAIQWGQMTVRIMKQTPNGSPTYGSRAVGYMGLTMYETVVNGSPKNKSLDGQLSGLANLPKVEKSKKYNWILSLNAGQSYMLKQLYEHTSAANKASIDSLENLIYQSQVSTTSQEVRERSVKYGQEIAQAIVEWSKIDGGYQGYKRNFDSTYQLPKGKGYWKSPPKGQSPVALPLHPYWGNNRTFAPANGVLAVPEIIKFDYHEDSDYYKQMMEVYHKRKNLTQEEKEIANWWGDDPSQTFSPPGHSYNLATIAIKNAKPDLFKAAETYARVGMAVADAFINCWKCKYTYHAERPFFFIFYNVDTMWDLYWPEPPFPAFYSGHAGQASASATVLTNLYGDNFKFIDNSHVGRPKDEEHLVEYKARSFNSFWESALESANSRLYGGIHTRQDNEVGLSEGKKIGHNINTLAWRR